MGITHPFALLLGALAAGLLYLILGLLSLAARDEGSGHQDAGAREHRRGKRVARKRRAGKDLDAVPHHHGNRSIAFAQATIPRARAPPTLLQTPGIP